MKADIAARQPQAQECQQASDVATGRRWGLPSSLQEMCVPAANLDLGLVVSRTVGA